MNQEIVDITVAVLPFENLSESDDLQHFVPGFTEDLIIDLSRFNALQIISHHSSGALQANPDPEQIKALNVDYFVKGSFRYLNGNIRISTQLINTKSNSVVWAERFDQSLEDIFNIQDEIIEHIVNILQQQIQINLLEGAKKKPTTNLAAYDYWLQGMEHLKQGTLDGDIEARKLFEKALESDPKYSRALSGLSLSYFNEWSCQLWDRWDINRKGAHQYAEKAVQVNENDYVALMVLGRTSMYLKNFDQAEHYLRKSLRLNPNDADNLIQIASCMAYLGYAEEADNLYLKAKRLNPLNQDWYDGIGAFIQFELGDDRKTVELGLKVPLDKSFVDLSAFIAAAFFNLGKPEEAKYHWGNYLDVFKEKISGGKTPTTKEGAEWIIKVNPYKLESRMKPFFEFICEEKIENTLSNNLGIESVAGCFREESGIWNVGIQGNAIALKEMKGFFDIRTLLQQPNTEIHCMELMGGQDVGAGVEVMDEQSKDEIQKKVAQLMGEMEEAEQQQNYDALSRLRNEYDSLVDHLSGSLGLKGKSRTSGSSVEKARSAITWRIRSAIKKIDSVHPQLSAHLSNSIKTGTFCTYKPEKLPNWEF